MANSTRTAAEPRASRVAAGAGESVELLAGRYRLLRELRPGSTGGFHLAVDTRDDELVAIKTAGNAARIRNEAAILGALDHPGIVRLKDRSDGSERPYLVLRFVNAPDLATFLARQTDGLDRTALRQLLIRLADAVAAIHAAGFLHRDLKPANILVRPDLEPVIVDFGGAAPIARDVPDRWSAVSDGYAAPEQYLSDQPEGPWTDVYALGAIAYRALSGHAPPAATARLRGEPLPPARGLVGDRDEALGRAIDWALELEPAARPQTVDAWRDALSDRSRGDRPVFAGPEQRPDPDDYPPTRKVARVRRPRAARREAPVRVAPPPACRRRTGWLPGVLVLLGAGLAAGAWYGWPLYERHLKSEWTVDPDGGGDARSIADALARAGDGAMITIRAGTYGERLRVDRPVHLVAATPDDPPVIAPPDGPCLLATATGSITGLHFRAAATGEAPCIDVAQSLRLEGNVVEGAAGPAILVRDGAAPTLQGNRIAGGTGPGIVITAGARGTIADNVVAGVTGPGVVVRGGAAPTLTGNTLDDTRGVVFAEGARGTFRENRIVASTGSAIEVTTGADPLVADNVIENAGEAGVFVYDFGKGRFANNRIENAALSGVVIATGGAPQLVGNEIRGSGEHGIIVVQAGGGVLESNRIAASRGHGILIDRDAEVEVSDNQLDGNRAPQLFDARAE